MKDGSEAIRILILENLDLNSIQTNKKIQYVLEIFMI